MICVLKKGCKGVRGASAQAKFPDSQASGSRHMHATCYNGGNPNARSLGRETLLQDWLRKALLSATQWLLNALNPRRVRQRCGRVSLVPALRKRKRTPRGRTRSVWCRRYPKGSGSPTPLVLLKVRTGSFVSRNLIEHWLTSQF